MKRDSLKVLVSKKIRHSRRNVFLRSDFEYISKDYDQVGRALRQLVKDKQLLRMGYGLYTKACINSISGKPMIAAKGGFSQVSREALKRLNVEYDDVFKGISQTPGYTQVSPNTIFRVKSRFSRKINVGDKFKLKIVDK